WEELTIPGPRLPITADPQVFQRGVALGRRLLFLHTYGERFGTTARRREIPSGKARCTVGVSTSSAEYPETVSWSKMGVEVGMGVFEPVPEGVWEFSVSGYPVVESWIKSRLRDRTGRRSTRLDEIRPETWSAEITEGLLELL